MTKRMLIDATHEEETRVVVLNGNRLEEFDFETSTKKQLKGNIYLAKVTRVEPSLQAAFVDFGGNRHGFLAFSEIHPDYYQIPVADRIALLEEEKELAAEDELDDDGDPAGDTDGPSGNGGATDGEETEVGADGDGPREFEEVGGDDEAEMHEAQRRRPRPKRQRYKIQEVIKRRQIILVQVVKEERGNKGAALTTYLSLAGRYCVLMPNTTKGGGISRKITNPKDRKRLKDFVSEFDIPDGVAVILRTAAVERSKAEIKRDFEYLIRTWDQVRETTLESIAPTLVYEEGNLIKRSIRDLYSKDIDEVLVEGDEGYKTAKDFMRMLMPSHAKKVQPYKDESIPMFHRYQVESQMDAMHSPQVQLKSGGYIVINPTEALVSIDVNSGRATRERNIEETAYKTNLEASEEIARQLKLRDLAGLIVIDFIDMAESRNQHTVERRLKEAMRSDRARIQIGRISPFGLMELSRQRLRPSLIEASTEACPNCAGTGLVRSTESSALHVLRMVEEEGIRKRSEGLRLYVPTAVAFYILNQKRDMLTAIEARHDLSVLVMPDDALVPPNFRLERFALKAPEDKPAEADAPKARDSADAPTPDEGDTEEKRPKRRRSRRRRSRRGQDAPAEAPTPAEAEAEPEAGADGEPEAEAERSDGEPDAAKDAASRGSDKEKPKRRRRGRRGGRRQSRAKGTDSIPGSEAGDSATGGELAAQGRSESAIEDEAAAAIIADAGAKIPESEDDTEGVMADVAEDAPQKNPRGNAKKKTRPRRRKTPAAEPPTETEPAVAAREDGARAEERGNGSEDHGDRPAGAEAPEPSLGTESPDGSSEPRRRGWWNRLTP